ncbi:MAG: hypothetical protein PVJ80_16550 [Gemmatimonadota bacterium]|jgi:hypothetical protein
MSVFFATMAWSVLSLAEPLPVGPSSTGPLSYPSPMSAVEAEFGLEPWDTSDWGTGWCEFRRIPIAEADTIRGMFVDNQLVRVDVREGERPTTRGVLIGTAQADAIAAYDGNVTISPHRYVDGSYLVARDGDHAVVMETDGQMVTSFRAGLVPYVEWVEGCS